LWPAHFGHIRSEESAVAEASHWHALDAEQVLEQLGASDAGLSSDEASVRLQQHGPNRLPVAKRRSALLRFLLQFHNILIYVLLGSSFITALLGHLLDTMVILGVVIANAIIGYIQEGKAEAAMDAIRQMLAPRASVRRDGERRGIEGDQLVPGDIVLLEAGDKVPADLRLVSVHGLQIQEAILTGESMPVEKHTAAVAPQAALGDRSCLAFSGTLVTAGQARGVAVATGASTEIGRISGMLADVEPMTTPLVEQMAVFSRWLTVLILLIAGLLLVYGYFVGHMDFADMFLAVVGLSVAAIPEGLPAVLTITLAIGVQAMARRNAIVRRLPAIETLGSVSVICTDKTGTLTRNEMVVASVLQGQQCYQVQGVGYEPAGCIEQQNAEVAVSPRSALWELAHAAALCNDAALREQQGEWKVEGDPMEGALLAFAARSGLNLQEQHKRWPRTDAIPFDARHRFMATLHHDHEGNACIYVKGAPERLLGMCSGQQDEHGVVTLQTEAWLQRVEATAALGQRVLAFAMKRVPATHTLLEFRDVEGDLVLLGMTGMIDPPREEAIRAVAECRSAGIQVKMITGDHASTAAAIGRQIGLARAERVLTGAELDTLDDTQLREQVLHCDIFARTSPEHKLRLVIALQAHGMTVAMTGDGVNDAPALKRADAGIAMGKGGSEVAKEASDLVLADDNFASIVAAVREGRTVYANIKKVISWTLPTSAGEALTIIAALLFAWTLPVTAVQILWVNLITAVTLGLALAFEPTESLTMQRPPRARNEPLLGGDLVWHVVLVALLFLCGVLAIFNYALDRGHSVELARTLSLNTLVVMEIFHLFFIRNMYKSTLGWADLRGTPIIWSVVLIITVAQFAVTYLPPLQRVFQTQAVPLFDGLLVVGIGVALFIIIEVEKRIRLALRAPPAVQP
jgi:calcium-translocating P-type ATPase